MKKEFKIEVENRKNIFIEIILELKDKDKINYDTLEIIPKNTQYILSTTVTDNKNFSGRLECCKDDLIISNDKDKDFYNKILELEKKYCGNDLQCGTKKQLEYLESINKTNYANQYSECVNYLKEVNLFIDRGYEFGTNWLLKPIEKKDLDFLLNLFKK